LALLSYKNFTKNDFKFNQNWFIFIVVQVAIRWLLLTLWLGLGAEMPVSAAHTQARLLLASEKARPGDTVWAAVNLQMEKDWHTYWRNPGPTGIPTAIAWKLPGGVTAGEIRWPAPEKLPAGEFTTYIYSQEVALLIPLKLAPDLAAGPLELKAEVSWLECKVQCIQGRQSVHATLTVAAEARPSQEAAAISAWQNELPKPGTNIAARAWWEGPGKDESRSLGIEWNSTGVVTDSEFFPDASEEFEVQPATERIPADADKIRLRKVVKKLGKDWPVKLSGVLVEQSSSRRLAYEVTLPLEGSGQVAASGPKTSSSVSPGTDAASRGSRPQNAAGGDLVSAPSLGAMLLYAFLGGLILNIMPCVLPVIALKILGFVGQAKDAPHRVRKLGLIYAVGVLCSFLLLAGLVIGVKAAGHRAGWGMQFGNPQFLVVLTVLVTLVALNLFGVFEVNLGGQVMSAAGSLTSKHGASGAFFNGVLATVLATPCTAPFLGTALGFAFVQGTGVILLMFVVVGLGLSAPYVLLSWQPAWLKFLPKPGPWMERFKVAMGFPILATAVWLFSLLPVHYGKRTLWLGLFLVLVALAAWMYGQFVQRGRTRRGTALAVVLVLLVVGYLYAVEGQLRWRAPEAQLAATGRIRETPDGIDWKPWSPTAVTEARAAGQPVFVDFTADWCTTCQANKRLAIEIPSVRARLKSINAVPLLGDYTKLPEDITEELYRHGRAGVPLVLVYPKDAALPAIVLPELLTPGTVLAALDQAAR
jgi:thiol:disulfide interchange protein DsbD